jgi:hypothetical protein
MLINPENGVKKIVDEEHAPFAQCTLVRAFDRLASKQLPFWRAPKRLARFNLIGADPDVKGPNGFIQIAPKLDGRIKMITHE